MSVADVDLTFTIDYNWKGTNYTFLIKRPSFNAEGEFVHYVRQRAIAATEVIPDPATRKEALSGVIGDIAVGKYDWEHDVTSGTENYVRNALMSSRGIKQWMFIVLRQSNAFISCEDGQTAFNDLWKDTAKRNELDQKIGALLSPNPQMPPVGNQQTPKGAEAAVASGATSKSNQS